MVQRGNRIVDYGQYRATQHANQLCYAAVTENMVCPNLLGGKMTQCCSNMASGFFVTGAEIIMNIVSNLLVKNKNSKLTLKLLSTHLPAVHWMPN